MLFSSFIKSIALGCCDEVKTGFSSSSSIGKFSDVRDLKKEERTGGAGSPKPVLSEVLLR
jgi:hypothetical protein